MSLGPNSIVLVDLLIYSWMVEICCLRVVGCGAVVHVFV